MEKYKKKLSSTKWTFTLFIMTWIFIQKKNSIHIIEMMVNFSRVKWENERKIYFKKLSAFFFLHSRMIVCYDTFLTVIIRTKTRLQMNVRIWDVIIRNDNNNHLVIITLVERVEVIVMILNFFHILYRLWMTVALKNPRSKKF